MNEEKTVGKTVQTEQPKQVEQNAERKQPSKIFFIAALTAFLAIGIAFGAVCKNLYNAAAAKFRGAPPVVEKVEKKPVAPQTGQLAQEKKEGVPQKNATAGSNLQPEAESLKKFSDDDVLKRLGSIADSSAGANLSEKESDAPAKSADSSGYDRAEMAKQEKEVFDRQVSIVNDLVSYK